MGVGTWSFFQGAFFKVAPIQFFGRKCLKKLPDCYSDKEDAVWLSQPKHGGDTFGQRCCTHVAGMWFFGEEPLIMGCQAKRCSPTFFYCTEIWSAWCGFGAQNHPIWSRHHLANTNFSAVVMNFICLACGDTQNLFLSQASWISKASNPNQKPHPTRALPSADKPFLSLAISGGFFLREKLIGP